jgi:hypothetical protein
MDDYTSNVLNDSKNEWSILLINYITPHIVDGFRSIFNEAVRVCEENDEIEKYLMTYQNLLARIPKWNQQMITTEHERIVKLCNCSYLEDILTCVHIIQLKVLSCVRVGNETKKVKIDIPEFSVFLHNVYTNIARKLYSSIYLFEIDVPPLEQQKRNREFELMVQTCIMNTIRDKIPVETILRQFIDETQEVEVSKVEKILEQKTLIEPKPVTQPPVTQPPVTQPVVQPVIQESTLGLDTRQFSMDDNMPSFFDRPTFTPTPLNPVMNGPVINEPFNSNLNDELDHFEKLAQQNSIINSATTHKVGFSDNNSVLTFDSPPSDDAISLGETIQLNALDIEDLDSSKPESVKLEFEEL